MKRDGSRSRGARSSTRSTASARRRKRMQRSNHHPNNNLPYDTDFDASSVYQSQNQLINSHYDVSSLDSFNPGGGHANPLYGGSVHSTGSRFSVYTINPNASTVERIHVSDTHHNQSSNHVNHYDPTTYNSLYDHRSSYASQEQSHYRQYGSQGNNREAGRPPEPATIGRRSYRRPRSPIYMNSNETSM
jgi:hypothetical protein